MSQQIVSMEKVTSVLDTAVVSFLSECKLRERLCLIWVKFITEQAASDNKVDGMAQVFMVKSKRIIGAQQKSRRCYEKESSVLRGSSQYTLRNHLIAC